MGYLTILLRITFTTTILLLITTLCLAQDKYQKASLTGPYFGQEPPGDVPQYFAPNILGSTIHSCPVFTPDGIEAYWSILTGNMTTMKYSVATDSQWTTPADFEFPLEFTTSDSPHITNDGNRLFFVAVLSTGRGQFPKENIWYMDRISDGWGEPQLLGPIINNADLHWQISVADNGNLYFSKFPGDIMLSEYINGQYTQPQILDSNINKGGSIFEMTPFIAPDESYLIFSRHDENAVNQYSDLYISFSKSDGSWVEAVPIEELNTPNWHENCPNVTRDGKYLFFVRDYTHWVSAEIINNYRAICGDANSDGDTNIGDSVFIINNVFRGGPAPDPICSGNANGDSDTNIGDAVYLINHVFKGGPPPDENCCQ
ncbi:MAG: hypothetical protein V3V99_14455 [candidate division Zixibacteria bacterium]